LFLSFSLPFPSLPFLTLFSSFRVSLRNLETDLEGYTLKEYMLDFDRVYADDAEKTMRELIFNVRFCCCCVP
jgi:hypothetical protein